VTQPSLTRAIQKLEEEFGGALFRRERNLTHLTELGRRMVPHLQITYDSAQAAKQLARGVEKAQVTPLALGIDSAIEAGALGDVLKDLGEGLPGFELSLTTGNAQQLLDAAMSGDLDLVIVELPDDVPDRIDSWTLFRHSYFMVTRADHPLAARANRPFSAACDELWIDHDGRGCVHLKALAASQGFEPDIRHRASSIEHVKQLVAAGLGSAFMPKPREASDVQAFKFDDVDVERDVALGAVSGRQRSVAADAFVRASRARNWAEP